MSIRGKLAILPVQWLFGGYLLLVAVAELLTSLVSPLVGLMAHMGIIVCLLVHAALGKSGEERKLAQALILAPMIRILSISMPLIDFPKEAWFPLVSIPLLVATAMIVRQQGISRKALSLRLGNPIVQLLIVAGGAGLGVVEFAILRPEPLVAGTDWTILLLAALSLVIFTGFNEEIIFRGLLQALTLPVLRKWALLYVAVLFGVLHIGYLSLFDVLFVTSVGLLFGYLVRWSGSLLGVTLAHGLTNIMLFLVMPHLARQASPEAYTIAIWVGAAGAVSLFGVTAFLWRRAYVPTLADIEKDSAASESARAIKISSLSNGGLPIVLETSQEKY